MSSQRYLLSAPSGKFLTIILTSLLMSSLLVSVAGFSTSAVASASDPYSLPVKVLVTVAHTSGVITGTLLPVSYTHLTLPTTD